MHRPNRVTRRAFLRQTATVVAATCGAGGLAPSGGAAEIPPKQPAQVPALNLPRFDPPQFPDRTFSITDFGARCDGTTKNTAAIAAAIAACVQAGGGRVLVPAGVWLTGPVHLRSNVNLHLADGAVLRFSSTFADYLPVVYMQRGGVRCYNYSPLVYARDCTNVALTGRGTLDGQGPVWWPWKKNTQGMTRLFQAGAQGVPVDQRVFGTEADGVRPPFVQLLDCRNVLVEGVTLLDGPSWNLHPVWCENVTIRGVRITALGPNNDGIDPDACRNVLIEDCVLDTGDDCICLKAGRNEDAWAVGRPLENVLIRRCQTKRGHAGVALGSEMSAGIRHVLIEDCRFDGTQRGFHIKSCPGRGGVIEHVRIQNIAMDKISGTAIRVTLRYAKEQAAGAALPKFRDFQFRNITCGQAKAAIELVGLPGSPLEDITLENVAITAKTGLQAEHVQNLQRRGVTLNDGSH